MIQKGLSEKYSYNQIMSYLEQVKKYYDVTVKSWKLTKTLKYIEEMVSKFELD